MTKPLKLLLIDTGSDAATRLARTIQDLWRCRIVMTVGGALTLCYFEKARG